jgi:aspartate aminotransferase-like enzyme
VLAAMSKRLVGHLDPYFVELMDQAMGALRYVFRTENHHTLPISATGSGGLEAIMMNLLEPGDDAIVCITGYFGQRLAELARRAGADVRTIEAEPGEIVDVAEVDRLLEEKPAKLVAFVHLETTTGACQPIAPMVAVAKKYGALVMMDCVTSLGGVPIDIDALGVDAAGSCTQKCLGAPPGLGPITVNARAMEMVKARKTKPHTWYFRLPAALPVLGRHRCDEEARVSPHGARLVHLRDSRSAAADRRRGPRDALGAASAGPRDARARAGQAWSAALHAGSATRADDQRHQRPRRCRRGEGARAPARHGRRDGWRAWRAGGKVWRVGVMGTTRSRSA